MVTSSPVSCRIGSVSLPSRSMVTSAADFAGAVERALALRITEGPGGVAPGSALHVPGGRVVVESGAGVEDVARAVAALVHRQLAEEGRA